MKRLILLLLPLFMLASCIKEDDIKFHKLEDMSVSVGPTTVINAVVSVENSSRRNVRVSDAAFRVTDRENNEIGTVTVPGQLRIPKRSTTSIAVPIRIRLSNPLLGLGLLSDMEKNAKRLYVTGDVVVRAGLLKKKIKIKDMPLSEFMSIFTGEK